MAIACSAVAQKPKQTKEERQTKPNSSSSRRNTTERYSHFRRFLCAHHLQTLENGWPWYIHTHTDRTLNSERQFAIAIVTMQLICSQRSILQTTIYRFLFFVSHFSRTHSRIGAVKSVACLIRARFFLFSFRVTAIELSKSKRPCKGYTRCGHTRTHRHSHSVSMRSMDNEYWTVRRWITVTRWNTTQNQQAKAQTNVECRRERWKHTKKCFLFFYFVCLSAELNVCV